MSKNRAASVHARLLTISKAKHRPFQEILQHYVLERFLYRLSISAYSDSFLLKGALILHAWGVAESRPTRDIDLLGYGNSEVKTLERFVREVCAIEAEEDGLRFDLSTLIGRPIKEGAEYEGVRLKLVSYLGNARVLLQLDIGFDDVVHPGYEERDYPTILDMIAPRLRMYPKETVIAEKFEAMVYLGTVNSRLKDFFDIWLLSSRFEFEGKELARAISKTFANRKTAIKSNPIALTREFGTSDYTQNDPAPI